MNTGSVKTYTREDLVTFGNYLLSDLRRSKFNSTELNDLPKERISKVHDADIANWQDMENEVSIIFETMKQEIRDQMFIDSLSIE